MRPLFLAALILALSGCTPAAQGNSSDDGDSSADDDDTPLLDLAW